MVKEEGDAPRRERLINLPDELWEIIDEDARRSLRSRTKQIEMILANHYRFGEGPDSNSLLLWLRRFFQDASEGKSDDLNADQVREWLEQIRGDRVRAKEQIADYQAMFSQFRAYIEQVLKALEGAPRLPHEETHPEQKEVIPELAGRERIDSR